VTFITSRRKKAPAPPVTRTRLGREERRNLILDAATEVFGRLGFDATRMDDVAKAAGIAKGLLYKHFASKDALFEALVDRQGREYAAELRGALRTADVATKPFDAMRSGLSLWLRTVDDDHATFNFSDPGGHDAYHALRQQMRDVIVEALREAQPTVTEHHARLIAALIQGSAENLGMAWREDPGPVTAEEALEILAAFCWGGVTTLRAAAPEA
jgi:AcrR family transcriptional regulator